MYSLNFAEFPLPLAANSDGVYELAIKAVVFSVSVGVTITSSSTSTSSVVVSSELLLLLILMLKVMQLK